MTDQELRKLGRKELVEILLEQSKQIQELQNELEETRTALKEKVIKIDQAGSIAEAALSLNGVFEAAQEACRQYTDNISLLNERQEKICAQRELESQEKAEKLIAEAEKRKAELEQNTRMQCEKMVSDAKKQSEACWEDISGRLKKILEEHAELKQVLSTVTLNMQGKTYEAE